MQVPAPASVVRHVLEEIVNALLDEVMPVIVRDDRLALVKV